MHVFISANGQCFENLLTFTTAGIKYHVAFKKTPPNFAIVRGFFGFIGLGIRFTLINVNFDLIGPDPDVQPLFN